MSEKESVKLPDCLPGGKKGEFFDTWGKVYKGEKRPEEFNFPEDSETSLTCKECDGKFYATERRTTDHHYDEVICIKCKRIGLVSMEMESGRTI